MKALQKFGDLQLVEQIIPGKSNARPVIKLALPVLAFMLIVAGLANIQWGSSRTPVKHQGLDLAIVLDVSNSMLAQDAEPSRLQSARQFASQLIDRLPDEKIALIIFAGSPVLMTPLTVDHSAAQLMLNTISVDDVPKQGTDIAAALEEAIKALPENQQHYRAIILISDGEHQGGSINETIKNISEEQVVVCTAGVGTEKGAPIPLTANDPRSVKHDKSGNVVITKFNPAILKNIAEKCHGIFVRLSSGNSAVNEMVRRLDAINKNMFDEELLQQYESRFQWFLFPALVLLSIEIFISSKRRNLLNKLFKRRKGEIQP
jgi:Ca-activated chloride channel family protein